MSLLNEVSDSRFVTRKWNIFSDQPNPYYDDENEITYNTEVLKCNLCDCNDAHIFVRGNITIIGHAQTQVAFWNWASFTKCITKIDGITVDDAEASEFVTSLYNLLEYSLNYSDTTDSLLLYSE